MQFAEQIYRNNLPKKFVKQIYRKNVSTFSVLPISLHRWNIKIAGTPRSSIVMTVKIVDGIKRRQATDASTTSNSVVVKNVEKTTLVDVVVDVGHFSQQPQVDRLDLVQGPPRVVVVVQIVGRLRRRTRRQVVFDLGQIF